MGSNKKRSAGESFNTSVTKCPRISASDTEVQFKLSARPDTEGPSMNAKQKPLAFMNLPGEIRNKVYENYFHLNHRPFPIVHFGNGGWFVCDWSQESSIETALLRTSKDMYREAHPFLFKDQSWSFDAASIEGMNQMLERIGQANRAQISELVLHLDNETQMWELSDIVFDCTNLLRMDVSVAGTYYLISKDDLFTRLKAGQNASADREILKKADRVVDADDAMDLDDDWDGEVEDGDTEDDEETEYEDGSDAE